MNMRHDHKARQEAASRGAALLEAIEDAVALRFGAAEGDGDCWHCGGEGVVSDCFDGFCENAEDGCEQCSRPCPECGMRELGIARTVRIEVLKSVDIEIARAWAAQHKRSHELMDDAAVLANLHAGRAGCEAFSDDERADSACWVEGLL